MFSGDPGTPTTAYYYITVILRIIAVYCLYSSRTLPEHVVEVPIFLYTTCSASWGRRWLGLCEWAAVSTVLAPFQTKGQAVFVSSEVTGWSLRLADSGQKESRRDTEQSRPARWHTSGFQRKIAKDELQLQRHLHAITCCQGIGGASNGSIFQTCQGPICSPKQDHQSNVVEGI